MVMNSSPAMSAKARPFDDGPSIEPSWEHPDYSLYRNDILLILYYRPIFEWENGWNLSQESRRTTAVVIL